MSASPAPILRCVYCGNRLFEQKHGERRIQFMFSRDHILPASMGKHRNISGRHRTVRPCCMRCNHLRAALGHCTGVLMLVLQEAAIRRTDPKHTARVWGMLRT